MLYIGLDDTDSPRGMCTTYLALGLSRHISSSTGYPLRGRLRLVRLNPTVPWKTRGNGALCMVLDAPPEEKKKVLDVAVEYVEKNADMDHPSTNPGVVVSPSPPPLDFYWRAVRGIVHKQDAIRVLERVSGVYHGFKNGRGVIGAVAATSWDPDKTGDWTYEVIAYRDRGKWGTPREILWESVDAVDRKYPSTFNNIDRKNRHIAIAPNTPCPVLFGIRGDNPEDLVLAKDEIEGERYVDWGLFLTNQATDDHIVPKRIGEVEEYESVAVAGRVVSHPKDIEGGHVIFQIEEIEGKGDAGGGKSGKQGGGGECGETKRVFCAAYEPTKEFRDIARALWPGDVVVCIGSVRPKDDKTLPGGGAPLGGDMKTINLEKLVVARTVDRNVKVANPVCPNCGVHMKSMGRGGWYRCKKCGHKQQGGEKTEKLPPPPAGIYEVPVCARRHLSRPLKRGVKEELKGFLKNYI